MRESERNPTCSAGITGVKKKKKIGEFILDAAVNKPFGGAESLSVPHGGAHFQLLLGLQLDSRGYSRFCLSPARP